MYNLIRPPVIQPNHAAIREFALHHLWTPRSFSDPTPTGINTMSPTNFSFASIGYGPGGLGWKQTRTDALSMFLTASGTPYPAYPGSPDGNRVTMFGIVSLDALTATGNIFAVGSSDSRFENRIDFHSTNGFRCYNVDSGYAAVSVLSIGSLPQAGRPIAVVARMSGTSYSSVQSLHTSDGQSASQTPTITDFLEIDANADTVSATPGLLGHVHLVGSSYRIWTLDQVNMFLADPWIFFRRPPIHQYYVQAAGGPTYPIWELKNRLHRPKQISMLRR